MGEAKRRKAASDQAGPLIDPESFKRFGDEFHAIQKNAPLNTGHWTGDKETLKYSGGIPMALNLLSEHEAHYFLSEYGTELPGLAGFAICMTGGAAIAIMSHRDRTITLNVPNQSFANSVLFTLIENKFLPRDAIPSGWGDVTEIRWFRMTNSNPGAFVFMFDTLWPGQVLGGCH